MRQFKHPYTVAVVLETSLWLAFYLVRFGLNILVVAAIAFITEKLLTDADKNKEIFRKTRNYEAKRFLLPLLINTPAYHAQEDVINVINRDGPEAAEEAYSHLAASFKTGINRIDSQDLAKRYGSPESQIILTQMYRRMSANSLYDPDMQKAGFTCASEVTESTGISLRRKFPVYLFWVSLR